MINHKKGSSNLVTLGIILLINFPNNGICQEDHKMVSDAILKTHKYFSNLPNCKFRYSVKYKNSVDNIEFFFHQGNYYFRRYDSSWDNIKDCVSYNGSKFFCLHGDHLVIGTNHKTPTFVGSFFSRNPLFNTVYYSLLDSENFELPYLISIENIQREFASYKIELSNKSNSLSVKNNQKINYTLSYLNDSIIPSEIFGELNKTNFKWKLLKSFSSEPFSIPSDIICNYYDKSGNITNDSYSIEMDIASFSILTSKPELKIFELPATIAKSLYDTDIGVTLKDECWK